MEYNVFRKYQWVNGSSIIDCNKTKQGVVLLSEYIFFIDQLDI